MCNAQQCYTQGAVECERLTESMASAVRALQADHESWPFCTVTFQSTEDDREIALPVPRASVISCFAPLECTLLQGLSDDQALDCLCNLPRFARELQKAQLRAAVSVKKPFHDRKRA